MSAAGARKPLNLTEYLVTETYIRLRVCERFGQPPEWLDRQEPEVVALLMANEEVRQAEESNDRRAISERH